MEPFFIGSLLLYQMDHQKILLAQRVTPSLIVFFTRYLNQTHFLFHSAQATCTHSLFLCLFFNIFILLVVQPDETYYIIDMICWRGYSMHDYAAEFRFFLLNSKLTETSAGHPPSAYHRYKFSVVPIYECTLQGLQAAYLRYPSSSGHDSGP